MVHNPVVFHNTSSTEKCDVQNSNAQDLVEQLKPDNCR